MRCRVHVLCMFYDCMMSLFDDFNCCSIIVLCGLWFVSCVCHAYMVRFTVGVCFLYAGLCDLCLMSFVFLRLSYVYGWFPMCVYDCFTYFMFDVLCCCNCLLCITVDVLTALCILMLMSMVVLWLCYVALGLPIMLVMLTVCVLWLVSYVYYDCSCDIWLCYYVLLWFILCVLWLCVFLCVYDGLKCVMLDSIWLFTNVLSVWWLVSYVLNACPMCLMVDF